MSRRKITQNEFIARINERNPHIDTSKTVYVNTRAPVILGCKKCGHFWESLAVTLTRNSRVLCPKCKEVRKKLPLKQRRAAAKADGCRTRSDANSRMVRGQGWWSKIVAIHGDHYICDISKFVNQNTYISVCCTEYGHGMFKVKPSAMLAGRGCQLCNNPVKVEDTDRKGSSTFVQNMFELTMSS